MPKLSDSMAEAVIVRWLKSPGDVFVRGDGLIEVETDKATVVYEAESDGTLGSILVPEGGTVAIGEPIATLANGERQGSDPSGVRPQQSGDGPAPTERQGSDPSGVRTRPKGRGQTPPGSDPSSVRTRPKGRGQTPPGSDPSSVRTRRLLRAAPRSTSASRCTASRGPVPPAGLRARTCSARRSRAQRCNNQLRAVRATSACSS